MLGKKLRQRRKELNLTLKEVGMAVGVAEATVQRWESGNIKMIKGDKLKALAQTLQLPVEELTEWTSNYFETEERKGEEKMNELQVFNNPEFGDVRTIVIDNEPWFVGKDVAEALGYSRPDHAITKHVDDEDKLMYQIDTSGQNRNMYIINESGVYSLIFGSKLSTAKKFKHWVTSEVLPALRKTGSYVLASKSPIQTRILDSDDYIKAAAMVAGCVNSRLPYVIGLLEKAGFDIPKVQNQSDAVVIETRDDKRDQLMNAMKGYSITELMKMFPDMARQVLYRYKNGTNVPQGDRYNAMLLLLNGESA